MAKTFRTWLGEKPPRVVSKFGDAELYEVVSEQDGVYAVGAREIEGVLVHPGIGSVSEIVLKWTWREKPDRDDQFLIRFNIPNKEDAPLFPVKVGGPRILRYAGEHVRGATSFTLLVNRRDLSHRKTWRYSDSRGYLDLQYPVMGASVNGPILAGVYGTIAYLGTHQFLEPVPTQDLNVRLYFSGGRQWPLGGDGVPYDLPLTDPTGGRTTPIPYSATFPLSTFNGQQYEDAYQDKFLDFFSPTMGYYYLYSGTAVDAGEQHVWTMAFLFEQEVTLNIVAFDPLHPAPLTTPVTSTAQGTITAGETSTERGLFADRAATRR